MIPAYQEAVAEKENGSVVGDCFWLIHAEISLHEELSDVSSHNFCPTRIAGAGEHCAGFWDQNIYTTYGDEA